MPYPIIYALGDCATIQDYDLPATAQGNVTVSIPNLSLLYY